ncbi:hypothetical protein P6B95_41950 [Streptomyces atratus]|uniref:hypothetical protein n=1 Tax=Streptomyces atratus TaxID=1893 RepID=UPI0019CB691A|nr:hypothetical protein [Streptomyces atratus]WPW33269.1 hypothetical protein P6B95_41950 [Streptomyces atratus]GGT74220.1 hypothetical protein GCM10010207_84580 [Streptomyces atratus]
MQYAHWHVLFWLSAGLGLARLALVITLVPESPTKARGRFDSPGAIGFAAGLMCLLLPVTKGGDWGWTSGTTRTVPARRCCRRGHHRDRLRRGTAADVSVIVSAGVGVAYASMPALITDGFRGRLIWRVFGSR